MKWRVCQKTLPPFVLHKKMVICLKLGTKQKAEFQLKAILDSTKPALCVELAAE